MAITFIIISFTISQLIYGNVAQENPVKKTLATIEKLSHAIAVCI